MAKIAFNWCVPDLTKFFWWILVWCDVCNRWKRVVVSSNLSVVMIHISMFVVSSNLSVVSVVTDDKVSTSPSSWILLPVKINVSRFGKFCSRCSAIRLSMTQTHTQTYTHRHTHTNRQTDTHHHNGQRWLAALRQMHKGNVKCKSKMTSVTTTGIRNNNTGITQQHL